MPARLPAVPGWFTVGDQPELLGNRCTRCGTVFFPKAPFFCRNPDCDGDAFDEVPLSRTGRIWSYTDAQYQPPPPFVPKPGGHQPFAIAAVELAAEQIVVLGQVVEGVGIEQLAVGQEVELAVETLYSDEHGDHVVYKWRPIGTTA
jgi:uncharacterized protein